MIDDISYQFNMDEEWLCREETILSSQPGLQYASQHYQDPLPGCATELGRRHDKDNAKKVVEGSAYTDAYISSKFLTDLHCYIQHLLTIMMSL